MMARLHNAVNRTFYKIWECSRCHVDRRPYSSKYKATVNLPKTKFLISMKDHANKEENIQQICDFDGLYAWQQNEKRQKLFILHDGPPYANGDPHVGHALNKIMKDITNRRKLLQGYKVHYVPGWDCHGMPIEQKALASIRADATTMSPLEIRKTAQKFSKKAIKNQMQAFQRWGVMADWNSCYYTFDKDFEVSQLELFYSMYEKGLIYQDYMPVHWSPSARTALAEAELEYNDQHVSQSLFVRFQLRNIPERLREHTGSGDIYAVIWTTTPWTVALNQAVCYGPAIKYALVKAGGSKVMYIIGADFIDKMSQMLNSTVRILATFQGSSLEGATYVHPLKDNSIEHPLLEANHVTVEKGTGLVHTAPAHGVEDFQIAKLHGLPLDCHVDEAGYYMDSVDKRLAGKHVLQEGSQTVLSLLKENILHQEDFIHSYPYDWRTKEPCILRASKQWFVNTSEIKEQAIECLNDVQIVPETSGRGMRSMLDKRTYWCISRQRAWGVPIPVFYRQHTGDVLLSRHSVDHLNKLVSEHGSDCWWSLPVDNLLPAHVKEKSGFKADDMFEKGSDVLDIWFDSGATWSSVLKGVGHCSDVYLEGVDQFGGWFQSSLLTSVAAQQKAPYKSLVVHGFVLDEQGKKMSKSLGNVIDPEIIVSGGKDLKKEPAYGADVLRWWVASAGLDSRVSIGPSTIDQCNQQLFVVRKNLRYLLGNLYDFDVDSHTVSYSDLLPTDKYMLHLLHDFLCKIENAYESYSYDKVLRLCDAFMKVHVSAFYSSATKDRMYCSHATDVERRSCQTVQYYLIESLTKTLAPIAPHLCEDVYQHCPFVAKSVSSLFKTTLLQPDPLWQNQPLEDSFNVLFKIRDVFRRTTGSVATEEFDVTIHAEPNLYKSLKLVQEDEKTHYSSLCEVFQVSTVAVLSGAPQTIPQESHTIVDTCLVNSDGGTEESKFQLVITKAEKFICERCRRYTAGKYGTPCDRCMNAIATGWE